MAETRKITAWENILEDLAKIGIGGSRTRDPEMEGRITQLKGLSHDGYGRDPSGAGAGLSPYGSEGGMPQLTPDDVRGFRPSEADAGVGLTMPPEMGGPGEYGMPVDPSTIAELVKQDRTRGGSAFSDDARARATDRAVDEMYDPVMPEGYGDLSHIAEGINDPGPDPTGVNVVKGIGEGVSDVINHPATQFALNTVVPGFNVPSFPGFPGYGSDEEEDPFGGQPFVGDFDDPDSGFTTPAPSPDKKPPATTQGGGTGGSGKPAGAGAATVPVDETPVKPSPMNAVQRFAAEKLGLDEDQRSDLGRALLMGGLATMAGDSPDAMQNIGQGGMVGAGAYFDAGDERYERGLKEDALEMQKQLHEMRMAEGARAAQKHGIEMKKLTAAAEAGVDPLGLLTGSAKSKAQAAQLYKNGIIDEETYNSILGIDDEDEFGGTS